MSYKLNDDTFKVKLREYLASRSEHSTVPPLPIRHNPAVQGHPITINREATLAEPAFENIPADLRAELLAESA